MAAFLLAISLFVFLALVGKSVIEALSVRLGILRGWLLAPSVGLATVVLLTLNINQTGLSVRRFASALAAALAIFIAMVLWWKRPLVPWRRLAPFFGAALLSLLYSCWPMLLYGFRWYGYMNGDMAYYCLGAARMMNHGFYEIPTIQELMGTDYTQFMWFHSAVGMFRSGADVLLAWVASVTHLQPLQVSMPAMGATQMVELSSAAALVLNAGRYRRIALLTAFLVAVSPFYILGLMAQLLPQVGGLALLFCLCALCMKPRPPQVSWKALLQEGILIACVGAAACIYYPEVLPFGVLAIAAYHGWILVRRKQKISSLAGFGLLTVILLGLIARQSILTAVGTVLFAVSAGITSVGVATTEFDRVLDPSIFASLPGLEAYYGHHGDPWISIAITIGIIFLLLSVWIGVQYAWKGQPAAFLLLIMLGLGARLFTTRAAFGIFKLAMYIQPVYLFAVAVAAMRHLRRGWVLVLIAYLLATMNTANLYIKASIEPLHPSTMPGIEGDVVGSLTIAPGQELVLSSTNLVGGVVYAAVSPGTKVKWADFNYFHNGDLMDFMAPTLLALPSRLGLTRDYLTQATVLSKKLEHQDPGTEIILGHEIQARTVDNTPIPYLGHPAQDPWFSSNNADNKRTDNYFSFDPIARLQNYLVLLTSTIGGPIGGPSKVSRWPPEPDIYSSHTFYGIGRRLLFEVIHPAPSVRLSISLTRTLTGEGRTALPEATKMRAAVDQSLGFVGNGAAHVVTSPLELYERDGHFYFALDFGTDGSRFPNRKTGLLRLFRTDVPIDDRQMVGLVRDMALVTEPEYRNMKRPTSITSWPTGLLSNPNLEFSGIYEDGWVSSRAFVVLGQAKAGDRLQISGRVPPLGRLATSGNQMRILVNGAPVDQRRLKPGNFKIDDTLAGEAKENRIDFLFERMDQLPSPDDRPVSAQFLQIAIGSSAEARAQKVARRKSELRAQSLSLLTVAGR